MDFAAEPPAGQLRLASAAVTNFTVALFTAVAKTVSSTMFSTGRDEVNTECYTKDAQTQAALKQSGRTLEQALSVFTQATHGALVSEGKVPVVWEGLSSSLRFLDGNLIMLYRDGPGLQRNSA